MREDSDRPILGTRGPHRDLAPGARVRYIRRVWERRTVGPWVLNSGLGPVGQQHPHNPLQR